MSELRTPSFPQRTSGEYQFQETAFADFIIEAFERIGIGPAVLDDPRYLISARRSANLILQDMGGNRGTNLWAIGDEMLSLPLVGGQASYLLPENVVTLLDSYIRTYTPDGIFRDVGFSPTLVLQDNGEPSLSEFGEPSVAEPGSRTFWTQEGSSYVTMRWPGHGLIEGSPVFWHTPVTAGGMTIKNYAIVSKVIDPNTITFVVPYPAKMTRSGCGGTALFTSHQGQNHITVTLPFHWLSTGEPYPVAVPTTVGGITLHGLYTITAVLNEHQFLIPTVGGPFPPISEPLILSEGSEPQTTVGGGPALTDGLGPLPVAVGTDTRYENGGVLMACSQATGIPWTDVLLWPISRNVYAAMPNKLVQGRPSVYWFNRSETPSAPNTLTLWAVPAVGQHWAFVCYRMRYLQDASPETQLDLPRRVWPAFVSQLVASLAEKFKPELFGEKVQMAEAAWDRAANADREMVGTWISPTLHTYWR